MNSFSEAVKLAVEKGGYGNSQNFTEENLRFFIRATQARTSNSICLDPLFWQALGKALGWGTLASNLECNSLGKRIKMGYEWQWHALRYLNLKLSDGNEEQFFNELLKGK